MSYSKCHKKAFFPLYAWTNISYANFDCSKFCQMGYPNVAVTGPPHKQNKRKHLNPISAASTVSKSVHSVVVTLSKKWWALVSRYWGMLAGRLSPLVTFSMFKQFLFRNCGGYIYVIRLLMIATNSCLMILRFEIIYFFLELGLSPLGLTLFRTGSQPTYLGGGPKIDSPEKL